MIMKGINVFIGILYYCLLLLKSTVSLESTWKEWGNQLKKDVSYDTYTTLTMLSENRNIKINNQTLETFEQILKAFDTDFVQRRYEDAPLNTRRNAKKEKYYKWEHFNHWFSEWPAMYICLSQTSLARAAVANMRHYYAMRTLYTYDFEYEVGYLVYDLIHHYTALLELMNMIHYRYIKFRFRRTAADLAPVRYMWFVYRNMADLARKIILGSDMLYELKAKHENNLMAKGPISPFINVPLDKNESKAFRAHQRLEQIKRASRGSAFHAMSPAEQARYYKSMINKVQKQRNSIESLITKASPKFGSKKSKYHLYHYGWSIEDSWLPRDGIIAWISSWMG